MKKTPTPINHTFQALNNLLLLLFTNNKIMFNVLVFYVGLLLKMPNMDPISRKINSC